MRSKIILTAIFAFSFLQADIGQLTNFLKKRYSQNPYIRDLQVTLLTTKPIPTSKDWVGVKYLLTGKYQGKSFAEKIIYFTDGKNFTDSFLSLNGNDWKRIFDPKVQPEYYSKENLLFGSENSKNKIIIFSDPLCPFCQKSVPKLLNFVKKYPKTFAVYYYHLPLERIHPASVTLTKLMYLASIQGKKDAVIKGYSTRVSGREMNAAVIVDKFNQATGLNYYVKDVNNYKAIQALAHDKKVATELEVRGTPTIYLNGKKVGGEFYKNIKIVD